MISVKKIFLGIFSGLWFFLLTGCTSSNSQLNDKNKQTNALTLPPLSPFETNTIDGLLVSVADQYILYSDLKQAIAASSNSETTLLPSGLLVGGSLSPADANQILQNLINQKLLQIKALELGFDVTDDELSMRISDFLKQQGYTESDLEAQLARTGKKMQEYRAEFKNELLKQQFIGRVIAPLVTVTDDEVKGFYLQQTGSLQQISSIKLRSLMLQLDSNSKDPLNNANVKLVKEKIASGENFTTLVKKYSMALNASTNEGLLPAKPIKELPKPLQEQLTNLHVNQIVGPFLIGNSAFFFQYLGAEFGLGSDLQKNFASWKEKLQNIKFNERLFEYLKNEKTKLKANVRPFSISR